MTNSEVTRRRLLAAAAIAGSLAGCSGVSTDSEGNDTGSTPTPNSEPAPAATTKQTETATPEPEATIEVRDASLRRTSVIVGEPIAIEARLRNPGTADGTTELTGTVGEDDTFTAEFDVPAGETVQATLNSSPMSRTGTVSVALNNRIIGEVAINAPDVLHVAPDGANSNPGTEDAPLSTIQAAIDRAGPGQTVSVHSGEYIETITVETSGEPDAPITLTGPPDAVLKPPEAIEYQAVEISASYIHITGLTITGLYNPDEPANPASYHPGKLISLNGFPEDGDDYVEGLVVSPHRLGNAGQSLLNSQMIKNCDIGGFEVIGPAGAEWIFDDTVDDHNGEIVYLGTAPDNRVERGYEEYDRTRNIRVHHIDNSAGHPHSELVDCKEGVENVTVEYCTDGGGVQSDDSYYSQCINLGGRRCTVRWNVIQNAIGSGIEIGPWGFISNPEFLSEPQTALERQLGKEHAIYDNVFTGNTFDAIDFLRESEQPGQELNPLPADQQVLCGNLIDGYSDATPAKTCSAELPSGDGVGHLGGDSPWDGAPPQKKRFFHSTRTHNTSTRRLRRLTFRQIPKSR